MNLPIRILFLADSHLGFDLTASPRVQRRRRGHDFLANYAMALEPALAGEVDLVVHGGDVFDRPRVPASLAWQAFEPLARVARSGIPVFVVPGNHERSRLPHCRLARQPGVHIFDGPRTVPITVRGMRVAMAGFPYERRIRERFTELLGCTGWNAFRSDVSILCVHHCFEGARVGPGDYTFTDASDVIRGRDVPAGLAAVLSGHIHRHQVLTHDLVGRDLAAPVLYPGSIERTSVAERGEPKGYLRLDVAVEEGGPRVDWTFARLPARPMVVHEIDAAGLGRPEMDRRVRRAVAGVPADAVLRLRIRGPLSGGTRQILSMAHLRTFVPATMNVDVVTDERRFDGGLRRGRSRRRERNRGGVAFNDQQLELNC